MSDMPLLVLDSSVGVKWFLAESGSAQAIGLLEDVKHGRSAMAVPTHFVHEVLSVVGRAFLSSDIIAAWETMLDTGIDVVPLTDEVVREAAGQCESLGCSFYDALAPAVASLLGATLVSADQRAHAGFPGVSLLG